jgi:hypothetical protein
VIFAVGNSSSNHFYIFNNFKDRIPNDGTEKIDEGHKNKSIGNSKDGGFLKTHKEGIAPRRGNEAQKSSGNDDVTQHSAQGRRTGGKPVIQHGEFNMPATPHGIAGAEYHRPDKADDDNFHAPGEGTADYISKKNLKDKSQKHDNKRENRQVFFKYITNEQ